jgi:3-isopropylmalate/(R)-2-methylmalate dehydratase small subunit
MQGIIKLRSRTAVLPRNDVDTDQIIPARFLTTTTRDGLGASLFADWRYLPDGSENPDFELNAPGARDARILVAGRNFGCGSSREHAPWALVDYGFRAVVSTEIADIFRSNALKNGLLPVVVDEDTHRTLMAGSADVEIDLEDQTLTVMKGTTVLAQCHFDIERFARYCLMQGTDQLGFILSHIDDIKAFEQRHDTVNPA